VPCGGSKRDLKESMLTVARIISILDCPEFSIMRIVCNARSEPCIAKGGPRKCKLGSAKPERQGTQTRTASAIVAMDTFGVLVPINKTAHQYQERSAPRVESPVALSLKPIANCREFRRSDSVIMLRARWQGHELLALHRFLGLSGARGAIGRYKCVRDIRCGRIYFLGIVVLDPLIIR